MPTQFNYVFMRKRAYMAFAREEASSLVKSEADQLVRVALQEVLQKNEEVENARRGAELTAQQAMEMQAAALRAAEEHVAHGRRLSDKAIQSHVVGARHA